MRLSERLRDRSDHYLPDWAREVMDEAAQQIDDTAAFLDRHATTLLTGDDWEVEGLAAECRAMARKLRGET